MYVLFVLLLFQWSERVFVSRPVAVAIGDLQVALTNVVAAAALLSELQLHYADTLGTLESVHRRS